MMIVVSSQDLQSFVSPGTGGRTVLFVIGTSAYKIQHSPGMPAAEDAPHRATFVAERRGRRRYKVNISPPTPKREHVGAGHPRVPYHPIWLMRSWMRALRLVMRWGRLFSGAGNIAASCPACSLPILRAGDL